MISVCARAHSPLYPLGRAHARTAARGTRAGACARRPGGGIRECARKSKCAYIPQSSEESHGNQPTNGRYQHEHPIDTASGHPRQVYRMLGRAEGGSPSVPADRLPAVRLPNGPKSEPEAAEGVKTPTACRPVANRELRRGFSRQNRNLGHDVGRRGDGRCRWGTCSLVAPGATGGNVGDEVGSARRVRRSLVVPLAIGTTPPKSIFLWPGGTIAIVMTVC
jgi:hypothetical protein